MAQDRSSRQGEGGDRASAADRSQGDRNQGGTQLGRLRDEGSFALGRRGGNDPFQLLHRQMDSLFDDFARSFGPGSPSFGSSAPGSFGAFGANAMQWPNVDVSYDPERVHVEADLPGLEEKDVQVSVERCQLPISGEKKGEQEQKGRSWARRERTWGSFQRVIPLPDDVVLDKAEARFTRGVLTIDVPREIDERNRQRQIPIKGA